MMAFTLSLRASNTRAAGVLQHHKSKRELQSHAPEDQRRADGALLFGEQNANQQNGKDSQYASEALHDWLTPTPSRSRLCKIS